MTATQSHSTVLDAATKEVQSARGRRRAPLRADRSKKPLTKLRPKPAQVGGLAVLVNNADEAQNVAFPDEVQPAGFVKARFPNQRLDRFDAGIDPQVPPFAVAEAKHGALGLVPALNVGHPGQPSGHVIVHDEFALIRGGEAALELVRALTHSFLEKGLMALHVLLSGLRLPALPGHLPLDGLDSRRELLNSLFGAFCPCQTGPLGLQLGF